MKGPAIFFTMFAWLAAPAALVCIAAPTASTDFSVLPPDMEKLRNLDTRHRDLIEQAIRRCEGKGPETAPGRNPCVVNHVRRLLESSGDAKLQAFHHALPADSRYDPARTLMEWQPAVTDRIAETKPLPWESRETEEIRRP